MKIAIMTNTNKGLEAKVSSHFGRAAYLNIANSDSLELLEIKKNLNKNFGGDLSPPKFLQNNNITILLTKELGENAFRSLTRFGIVVYLGADGTVKEALEDYKNGKLWVAEEGDSKIIHKE
ncbi:MAG TPA: NifB/NifX family molybdenum-iron cluster-binding protein [candidate division Zixibacteria bacterium]|nr:NifB/NifX family molybdenum-iron cluster-binding protein [candidate division Zixibacteria bacterium]